MTFYYLVTLIEISQSVTTLFVIKCDYWSFVTTFVDFYNYFLCCSYLSLHCNKLCNCLWLFWFSSFHVNNIWFPFQEKQLMSPSWRCDQFNYSPIGIQMCILCILRNKIGYITIYKYYNSYYICIQVLLLA